MTGDKIDREAGASPEPARAFRIRVRPKAEPPGSSGPEPGAEAVGGEALWPPPRLWLLRLGMAGSLVGALLGIWLCLTALVWAITDLVLPFLASAYTALVQPDASLPSRLGGTLASARDLWRIVICLPASAPMVGAFVAFGALRKRAQLSHLLAQPDLRSGVSVTRLDATGITCRWPRGHVFTIPWSDVVEIRLVRDAAWEGHGFSVIVYRAVRDRPEQVAVWEGQTVGDATLGMRLPVHVAYRRDRGETGQPRNAAPAGPSGAPTG
ncbi:hypothetical protein ACQVP2_27950 [Methylobacterium aquaticum]|uniref:hypothetical protein n=1 Tax=Methylobacterium aquaticum TaxID=270351 RepID=UPI003D164EF4